MTTSNILNRSIDLDFNLKIRADGTVNKKFDNDSIAQSIKTIITTHKGERLMNPSFGSDVKLFLFDPVDEFIADSIETSVREALDKWEPRIIIRDILVKAYPDKNYYSLSVYYTLKNSGEKRDFTGFIRATPE